MDVGIRELKAKLSEYLGRASAGEAIVVTDRGTPVAILQSVSSKATLEAGARAGWVDLPRRTGLSEATPRPSALRSADVLDEDRGVTLYVDSSALLKRYVSERDSSAAVELMATDPVLVTSRLTEIEVRRNLARLLSGADLDDARRQFLGDIDAFALLAIDATIVSEASRIAEQTLARSLDAIHLASAVRAGQATTLLTFDLRQAQAARSLGLAVVGT